MTFLEAIHRIEPLDPVLMSRAQARLDRLTKPVGSLGRLECLAAKYVAVTGIEDPKPPRAGIFVFAADHGVTAEGVSAYPSAVTAQMVLNFLRGGAGVNVLADHVGAEIRVIDMGVDYHFEPSPGLMIKKVAAGSRNLARMPAMSRAHAEQALTIGVDVARSAAEDGVGLVGTGDMGIGNTTPSAAITALMTGCRVAEATGRGTGINDEMYGRKIALLEHALALHRPDPCDPLDVLHKVGGFEIAGLTGFILGAAARRIPVVLDGFIAGAAALLAVALQPRCKDYLIASHLSAESGHRVALQRLELKPLFDLDLRLGEGTGACLGISLIQASIKILTGMATFTEAGVSERAS